MKIVKADRSQADIVLALIQNRIDTSSNAEFTLDVYNNGRERGYVLQLHYVDDSYVFDTKLRTWIAFSENRNSDDTVVYTDNSDWNGRLTDKSYDRAHYFTYGDFMQAADYIIEIMENSIENVREFRQSLKEANAIGE